MPSPVRFGVVRKLLESKGYRLIRVRGSHHRFAKPGCPSVTIPVHHGQVRYVYYRQAEEAP